MKRTDSEKAEPAALPRSPGRRGLGRRFSRNRLAFVGLVVGILMICIAVFGPLVYGVDPNFQNYDAINAWPSTDYPLGTDSLGRDTLARIMVGLRVSLIVAFYVEALNIGVGATLGLVAGFSGGWLDNVISRLADMLFAFPGLLFAILVAAVFGQVVTEKFGGMGRLLLVAGSLALVGWPLMARYVRGETLSLKNREFVTAAHSIGAPRKRILRLHVLPGVVGLIIVSATLDVAAVVVSEAVLSLLGLGIQPPDSSIGQMIRQAIDYLETNWTQVFFPSLVLTLLVLVFSFVGDGLRDALDPQSAD